MPRKPKLERFNERILSKFQIYNSLFLTLPFKTIKNTSMLLPLFADHCKNGYKEGKDPKHILTTFFKQFLPNYNFEKQISLIFRFIQYIERQVVLFDAIEDAGFAYVNNMHGRGTLRQIKEEATSLQKLESLKNYLKRFNVRLVLTAHPTQFYPGNVLAIINDLSKAIKKDDLESIKALLTQLGKTRFYKRKKPSPYDEAISLIWYLETVFYHSASTIYNYIQNNIFQNKALENSVFDFGFWPGGDRDGNPYVTSEITLKTAANLKLSILKNYSRELKLLKRRLTFDKIEFKIENLENKINKLLYSKNKEQKFNATIFLDSLNQIHEIINKEHNGLYEDLVLNLINKVKIFGFHFASLDIRQDSRIHNKVFEGIISCPSISRYINKSPEKYREMDEEEKFLFLSNLKGNIPLSLFKKGLIFETLKTIEAIKMIQKNNGEKGSNRYIISNCQSTQNILELFALIRLSNWEKPKIDIIPLFETINDLEICGKVMGSLYNNPEYLKHLRRRGNKQTVMLGFSDGTKDGGYFMANWSIYKAKKTLTKLSEKNGLKIAFFDGRGGPPARGGGNTHEFYASLDNKIKADDIQLTIQGQTISSNFGTNESCQFNLEQLLSSGVENQIFKTDKNNLSQNDIDTLNALAKESYEKYNEFKSHHNFIPYLEKMTTLYYYSKANIGSRPSKRVNTKKLNFDDLRAIPFVGSWSQSKQNVPGFFGVGTALKSFDKKNKFDLVIGLYKRSSFFRTLISNSMMSLTKSFFELTDYMKKDPEFGDFWKIIHKEYMLSKRMILKLTGFSDLMENEQAGKTSIQIREEIVQPLLTIQQFALINIRENQPNPNFDKKKLEIFERIVTRSLFGNINASRNSA